MGYYATGYGRISFRNKLSKEEQSRVINLLNDDFDCIFENSGISNSCICNIWFDKKYHDSEIETLNELSTDFKVLNGEVDFEGEDGSHWRFIYINNNWVEQTGRIVYE